MNNKELLEFFKSHMETTTFLPVKGLVRLGYVDFPKWMLKTKSILVVTVTPEIREFILNK